MAELAHITRRRMLKGIAASSALAAPAVAAEHPEQPTLDEQLTECVATLRDVLEAMHPKAAVSAFRHDEINSQNTSLMFSVRYPELSWTGAGLYRLILDQQGHVETFWVDRYWAADDQKWMYAAAWWHDGQKVGPREIFSDRTLRIVEKLEA